MRTEMERYYEEAVWAEVMNHVLNGLNIAIYVSDMSTNKILYANEELYRISGYSSLIGRICWKALKDREKRCEFCPVIYLLKNPGKSYRRRLRADGRLFLVHDSIIPWINGSVAHLQYIVDITAWPQNDCAPPAAYV